ncbi:MAG: VCBS repeat-containing protein [Alphaproteobacteria bacterium]|nr:VCBS repeat-containing protein [Alphaproteobacteria bacterium]
MMRPALLIAGLVSLVSGASWGQGVGDAPSDAKSGDGRFITWKEHIIDDRLADGTPLSGGDGLIMVDLDLDGFGDIVSVHESDVVYDGEPDGFVRIAFGTDNPDRWINVTLVEGSEAGAPEDAAAADVNGDGYPDIVIASELAHLLYLQNPGRDARKTPWRRTLLKDTVNRGSFIRVFLGDLDGDGRPEATAANKGVQDPPAGWDKLTPVSVFKPGGNPLDGAAWREKELMRAVIPQNAQMIDIDSDGDIDVIAGERTRARLTLFENTDGRGGLVGDEIRIDQARAGGFNLDYADFNHDGRLDIVAATDRGLGWLEQPASIRDIWKFHAIGDFGPDALTGIAASDIDGDGDIDVISGGYSRGDRATDSNMPISASLGRLGWFANPGRADLPWTRHDISRRVRGMFDKFIARDMDADGDIDFAGTRGNSTPYDGVFWLEQVREETPQQRFKRARELDSPEVPLPPAAK